MAEQKVSPQRVDTIATLFNLTARRIQQLTQDGVLPTIGTKEGRRYDLLPTIQRYIKYLQDRLQGKERNKEEADLARQKDEADIKYKNAKADRAELELKELKGKMHRSEDVQKVTEDLIFAIRNGLMALPGRLAALVKNAETVAEASDIIKDEVHKLMTELAAYKYDPEKYAERVRTRAKMELEDDEE